MKNINDISIIDFLLRLKILPEKIQNNQAWYKAFYRGEKTASLKVDIKKNLFYDFGEGFGGSTLQLAERIYGCRGKELMEHIYNVYSSFPPIAKTKQNALNIVKTEPSMILNEVTRIKHPALLEYLAKRNILNEVAKYFCREVHYSFLNNKYFSIGFKNDLGGYELRNSFFKSSTSPKHYTLIKTDSNRLAVFEGFFDFLSFLSIHKPFLLEFDFLILNSVAMIQKLESNFFDNYLNVALFLDNDTAGKKAVHLLQVLSSKTHDFSFLYTDKNDLNDWLCSNHKKPDYNTYKIDFIQILNIKLGM